MLEEEKEICNDIMSTSKAVLDAMRENYEWVFRALDEMCPKFARRLAMDRMEVHPIGRIEENENGTRIMLDPTYGPRCDVERHTRKAISGLGTQMYSYTSVKARCLL
jgi:hypothetical protein